ncbi:MAG: Chain length determinant protein [Roseomonas sp.]|nr:Chain length determinant protein [Roseomonas sp.]
MPLDVLLRGVWALRYWLGACMLLLLGLGGTLVLSWPRAYQAQAVIAPAETTGLATSTLISASALSPGSLLDTRPSGNFAVYLAALRSPEAAAMLARDTRLMAALEARRAGGPAGELRHLLGLRLDADQDDARNWLERSLAVTQSLASVTWTLEIAMAERDLALEVLGRLHAFAEAKVRGDLLDLVTRRVKVLEARLATERDIYLRTPIFELLAQHQRAAMVLAADEVVAARLVSGPGVEMKPSLPNRPLLLVLLLVTAPLACLFGGACVVLLRGGARA